MEVYWKGSDLEILLLYTVSSDRGHIRYSNVITTVYNLIHRFSLQYLRPYSIVIQPATALLVTDHLFCPCHERTGQCRDCAHIDHMPAHKSGVAVDDDKLSRREEGV